MRLKPGRLIVGFPCPAGDGKACSVHHQALIFGCPGIDIYVYSCLVSPLPIGCSLLCCPRFLLDWGAEGYGVERQQKNNVNLVLLWVCFGITSACALFCVCAAHKFWLLVCVLYTLSISLKLDAKCCYTLLWRIMEGVGWKDYVRSISRVLDSVTWNVFV